MMKPSDANSTIEFAIRDESSRPVPYGVRSTRKGSGSLETRGT
jgi:hypothetical protein